MDLFGSSSIVGILIALVLIYALLSILVSILVEWWNHRNKSRGKMLNEAITNMLSDSNNLQYGRLFFDHHLISGFQSKQTKRPPQYISSSMFADVLIDVISGQSLNEVVLKKSNSGDDEVVYEEITSSETEPIQDWIETETPVDLFKRSLENMSDSPFRDMLASYYSKSGGDYQKLKTLLETWYNDHMDRVSGWYKTRQKRKFVIAGFVVAILLNVDSLFLIKVLSLNDTLTNRLVGVAEGVADDYSNLDDVDKLDSKKLVQLYKDNLGDSAKLDSVKFNEFAEKWIDKLDSTDKAKVDQGKQILAIATELKLPIGWNENYAPMSWFRDGKFELNKEGKNERHQTELRATKVEKTERSELEEPLMSYLRDRNQKLTWSTKSEFWDSLRALLLYFLGIGITGYSLSFGAPFWFETLVKLVNVRRAGTRPITSKPIK